MLKIIFLICTFITLRIFSSEADASIKEPTTASISGFIDAAAGDTVMLIVYADIIELRESGSVFQSMLTKDGYFHFDQLPVKHKGYRIYLCLRTKAKVYKLIKSNYLIEAGDSIYIRAHKTEKDYRVEFFGRGSEKYTCQRAVDSAMKVDQWLKSVTGGEYTNEGNINLYTDGQGFDHALTKYYGFNGGPYSLIIDKQGRIFAADPPKTDYKFLIEEIKRASKQ